MAPGDRTQVRSEDLLAHAGHVDAVAASVVTAQQAGETVRVDAGAYGRLCMIVPVLLGYVQDLVIDGVAAAADSLRDTGERVRDAAETYRAVDANSEADLRRASGPL